MAELSAHGDPLEKLAATVDLDLFRSDLGKALKRPDRSKGGRPPFDPVLMVRLLVLQAMHGLGLAQTQYLLADRLSWMRFCGLGPADRVPDANTLWDFREALIAAGALDALFARLDKAITEAGDLPMSGQIVDATLVQAPRQRLTDGEKAAIKDGRSAKEIWPDEPAKARQKDTHARWTMKFSKAKPAADGQAQIDIAVPAFGSKSHIWGGPAARHHPARRGHRRGRPRWRSAARKAHRSGQHRLQRVGRHGVPLPRQRGVLGGPWQLAGLGKASRIHRRTPRGKPMPRNQARANGRKSAVRARVEHPFAHQKGVMGLTVRTIGLARAKATITLANIAYNMRRWCWLKGRTAPA